MLNQIRDHAGGFAAKVLLALLILSFGVWGIGDMLRHPSDRLTVATVGDAKITRDALARAVHQRSEAMRSMMGDRYSPELLKSMNLPQQVLYQLINQTLLKLESASLGLVPSDEDVVRALRNNPSFQDQKGNFDKTIFDAILHNSGMSEKTFVEQMRDEMAASLLRDTFASAPPVSDDAVKTLAEIRGEQRRVTLYTMGPGLVSDMPAPTPEQLKAYYDEHGHEFTAPEYRAVSYVTINPSDVHADAASLEKDLKAAYQERIEEFKHPETRTVEQLLYTSKESADKAKAMLDSGKTFAQVAASTDITNKNAVSMGKIERSKLFEGAGDTVFALKNGEYTAPIQSPFGWHIFHVTAINPPATSSFEEVRGVLEKDMKQHSADDALNALANKLEDALAGGSTLAEAAKEMGLKLESVPAFNQKGETLDGAKAKLPDLDKFIDTAFKADEKSDSSLVASKGGIFYILHVDKVTPEHQRSLDEVKATVIAAWQKEERDKRLHDLAHEIATKFANAAGRADIIAKYHLQSSSSAIAHDSQKAGNIALSPQLVSDIFMRKPGASTEAYMLPGLGYILAVVDTIIPAPPTSGTAGLVEIRTHLAEDVQHEILEEYSRYLAKKYPVSVDQSVLQTIVVQ